MDPLSLPASAPALASDVALLERAAHQLLAVLQRHPRGRRLALERDLRALVNEWSADAAPRRSDGPAPWPYPRTMPLTTPPARTAPPT